MILTRKRVMADWSRRFEDPVSPPDGPSLITLRDAAEYMMALPKKELKTDHWRLAVEQVIEASEGVDLPDVCQDRHAQGFEPWQAGAGSE
jgi:hypothetical protein